MSSRREFVAGLVAASVALPAVACSAAEPAKDDPLKRLVGMSIVLPVDQPAKLTLCFRDGLANRFLELHASQWRLSTATIEADPELPHEHALELDFKPA